MTRSGYVLSLAAISLIAGLASAQAKELRLRLVNADKSALRCETVLAHFVSLPARVAAPDDELTWTWEHDSEAGTLGLRRDDGRLMLIENLICGRDQDWAATRGEVPLLALRRLAVETADMTCGIDGRLVCTLASD